MLLEQLDEAGLMPIGVAELDCEAPSMCGEREDEIAQSGGVALRGEGGGKLDEDGAEVGVEGCDRASRKSARSVSIRGGGARG